MRERKYWVRYSHIVGGHPTERGRFIVYGRSEAEAWYRAAEVLEAKGHVLMTRITSVKLAA
jgi:hypothetical protein